MSGAAIFSVRIQMEPFLLDFAWPTQRVIIANILTETLGTWPAAGWRDEGDMDSTVRQGVEADGVASVARGLPRDNAELLVAMISDIVECEAEEDPPGAEAATRARATPSRARRQATTPAPSSSPMDVERGQLLSSALGPILNREPWSLRPGSLTVKYQGEAAKDGAGGAGVTRAFLTHAGALIADVRVGLILPALQRHHQLSPCPGLLAPRAKDGVARQPERWSRFLGRLLGMSVAHQCPLGLTLVPSVCKQLLGSEASFEDMRYLPGLEAYHTHMRKWLMHRNQLLVPPEPSLERLSSLQIDAQIEGLPAEMPSKTQLLFEALLLRVEEAMLSEADWEEGVDVAACVLREAKTPEHRQGALGIAEAILTHIAPVSAGGDDDDPALTDDEKVVSSGGSPAAAPDDAKGSSGYVSSAGGPQKAHTTGGYADAASEDAGRTSKPEGLPRALVALRAALPEEISEQRLEDIKKGLQRAFHRHDVAPESEPHESDIPDVDDALLTATKLGRAPRKKRSGGRRRDVWREQRAAAMRSRFLDLEATPTDWYTEEGGYYTLSVQGSEVIYSELNAHGIIGGTLKRGSPAEPYEGDVYKTKEAERVCHGSMRLRIVLEDAGDYCVSNFKSAGNWEILLDNGWRPFKVDRHFVGRAGEEFEYENEYGSYAVSFTSEDQGYQRNVSTGTRRNLRRTEGSWGEDMIATRIPRPTKPSLNRATSSPIADNQLSRDNLPAFGAAMVEKALAGNLPYLSAIIEEFQRVVPDDTYSSLSRQVDFELPYSGTWPDVLEDLLMSNGVRSNEDKELLQVTERDGTRVSNFFGHDWRATPSASFPIRFTYQGWKRLQCLISGLRVDVDAWRSRTMYRLCKEDDPIVRLWWEYVAECGARSYEELRELFQWCTGWASAPTTVWKFQVCVIDEPSHLVPGKERLPSMILCMSDTSDVSNSGVKTPTLNLPRYEDRWEIESNGTWLPFEPGVPFNAGEDFDCDLGHVTFETTDVGMVSTTATDGQEGEEQKRCALRRVSAKATLAQKMWWALRAGQNMDAI